MAVLALPDPKFPYKTTPYPFQRHILRRSANARAFGILAAPGCGKSKLVIDTAAHQFLNGTIDTLLVLAPSGVHDNWVTDELPKHMPDLVEYECLWWVTGKAKRQTERIFVEHILAVPAHVLAVVVMNIESVRTPVGFRLLNRLVRQRKVFMVVDEAGDITTPGAKTTMRVKAIGRYAITRRILDGSLTEETPFHAYAPFEFLEKGALGHQTFHQFKERYGVWEERKFGERIFKVQKKDPVTGKKIYQNLAELRERMARMSVRVEKDVLNLPPKVYAKYHFDLSPEQRRMYEELTKEYRTHFSDGASVTADLTIVRSLRLYQIACGYAPVDIAFDDDADPSIRLRLIEGDRPRVRALLDVVTDYSVPTIIWCRFTRDIEQVVEKLEQACITAVPYHGGIDEELRRAYREAYMANEVQCFVANPAAAGRGLTLINTKHVIFYSNYYSVRKRIQAEDRAHRIGLEHSVLYTDLIARETLDTPIITALRNKREVADELAQRAPQEWI